MIRRSLVACLVALAAVPAHAEIGVLAAVNRDMTGARPSEPPRPVFIRDQLVQNERISTTADGGGQILFLDQTSLTISPNSDIVLDEYVYDPDAQSGRIGVSVARGALRLVGGRITKTGVASVTTPTATIGIRGGIGQTVVAADGSALHFHFAGISSTITSPRGSLTITREGGYARIGIDGVLEYLGIATPQAIAAALAGNAGRGDGGSGGGVGGAAQGVDAVAAVTSAAAGAVTAPPVSTTGERYATAFSDGPDPATDLPVDDFSTANLAEEIADRLEPGVDGIFFNGLYSASVTLVGNDVVTGNFPFAMNFSIAGGQGLAVASFPGELDPDSPAAPPGFDNFISDVFIVVKNGDQIVGDPVGISGLFGATENVNFTISAADRLNGTFTINYQDSPILANVRVLEGEVLDLGGIRIDLTELDPAIDAFREALQEFVNFNNL